MSRNNKFQKYRLKDIATIVSGSTPDTSKKEFYDGNILWATPKDLSSLAGLYISETAKKITKVGYDSCSTTLLPKGAVLFSSRAPIGLVAITKKEMCTNQGFKSFICGEKIIPEYLFYTLRFMTPSLQHLGRGATFKEISKELIGDVKISVPPLDIQRRMASILEKAESAREKRKEGDHLTSEFLKSAFLEMFGDPIKNPKGYKKIRLRELCEVITKGTTPTTYGHVFTEDGVRFLKIENIDDNGKILLDSVQYISKDTHKFLKRSQLLEGDMLFSIAGALGRTAIVTKECLPANINQALALIRLKPSYLAIEYLSYYLRAGFIIEQIRKNKRGVAQMNLNLQQVGDFDILLPPYELQQKFADLVQKVEKLKEKQQESEKELDNLFNSLMQKVFNREI